MMVRKFMFVGQVQYEYSSYVTVCLQVNIYNGQLNENMTRRHKSKRNI